MVPSIKQQTLLDLIAKTINTKIYIFSKEWHKDNGFVSEGWGPLTDASGGKWYELDDDMLVVYNSLMEIIDENACQ